MPKTAPSPKEIAESLSWPQMIALREACHYPAHTKRRNFRGALRRAAFGMARKKKSLVHEGRGGFIGQAPDYSYWPTELGQRVYREIILLRPDLFPCFTPADRSFVEAQSMEATNG
jgi:hypothetical protein